MKKIRIWFAILILILFLSFGGIYTFLSFEKLNSIGIGFGLSHTWHLIIGISTIVLGVVFSILTLLTDFLKKFRKLGQKYWYFFIFFDVIKWILIIGLGFFFLSKSPEVAKSLLTR
ncbi:MAG: hypothetical protein KKF56_05095 [Nanoarchaeota archaeon]|nr:hypothetical protein [Nanoarchaeota archaeon]